MSEGVDWDYWRKLPEVRVFEALALLEGREPPEEPPAADECSEGYRKRLRLLVASLPDRSVFVPCTLHLAEPARHGVRLLDVARWALSNGIALPDGFPQPVQPPKAPGPIAPIVGSSRPFPSGPAPANWAKWKLIPKVELWKAVCLSLDIEPDEERLGMRMWLQSRRGMPRGLSAEFADRLEIAQANMSMNGPLRPQALYTGVFSNPHAEVLLAELAAAAVLWDWEVPEQMRLLSSPTGASRPRDFPGECSTESAKPLQRSTAQEAAILRAVKAAGHDPQHLPPSPAGKPGVKAQIRKMLDKDPLFLGSTVFEKAWERMRSRGELENDEPDTR